MNFTAKVNVIKNPQGNTLGFATLIVNDVIGLDGFRIIQSKDGNLFVSAPSEMSKKIDEKTGKNVWFDRVRFYEDKEEGAWRGPIQEEAYQVILSAYEQAAAYSGRQQAAATARPARSNSRPNTTNSNTTNSGNEDRSPVRW